MTTAIKNHNMEVLAIYRSNLEINIAEVWTTVKTLERAMISCKYSST